MKENGNEVPDQSVDFGGFDIVERLYNFFNLVLVSAEVDNEYKGIVILNLLHGGLSSQWMLDDGVLDKFMRKKHSNYEKQIE
jgi:hypothetical protein